MICNNTILTQPAASQIGYLKYFHGFIDYDESKIILNGKGPGTFLMRFSRSKPGNVAIAWVAKKGDVKQCIVNTDFKTGTYLLGMFCVSPRVLPPGCSLANI